MVTLDETTLRQNAGYSGGGIAALAAEVALTDSLLDANAASGDGHGGGLYLKDVTATLSETDLTANAAGYGGGQMCIRDSTRSTPSMIASGDSLVM